MCKNQDMKKIVLFHMTGDQVNRHILACDIRTAFFQSTC